MEEQGGNTPSILKKNWKDYFDVLKYFIPFFIYFIVIWLQSNFVTKNEFKEINAGLINATQLSEKAVEQNHELTNSLFYEIKLIDQKLGIMSEDIAELKILVEELRKNP
jgi:hypothetical protein